MFGTKSNSFSLGSTAAAQPQAGGLFGSSATTQQPQQQGGGLFGLSSQQPQQPSAGLFGQPQQQQTTSLFGSTQPQQASGGMFGSSTTQNQPATGGLFGLTANNQAQPTSSLFGSTTATKPTLSLFGQTQQQQQNQQQQQTGTFGGFGQSQQQQQQQQQQQLQTQRPLDQTLRFGQSQQGLGQSQHGPPLWEEGRGLGVYRSIPAQMGIIKDKWDPASQSSPLRTYLFQHVGNEAEALRYRPAPGEDELKWEEAVGKRPGPAWVPLIVRGFFELGKKAQIQMEAIQKCNMMLQEINTSLDIQLDTHRQKVATRLAECRRRHQAVSQRTLALAVKVLILRNRGYVMDNAEEVLKAKLETLGREVMDPALEAREQEVWARMLGIREKARRLKTEMDKLAPTTASSDEPILDDSTVKAAKQTLEAYDTQLRHLQKELQLVQQEFADWENLSNGSTDDRPRRR